MKLIKRSDTNTGAAAQGLNLRLGRGKERDGDPKSAVLSWINGSVEPAAISVH